MLRRVAAFCCAAFIVVWPGCAGSDTDTFWNAPSAAVLAFKSEPAPVLAPAQQPVAAAAAAAEPEEKADAKTELPMRNPTHADLPKQSAALDPAAPVQPTPPASNMPPPLASHAPLPPASETPSPRMSEPFGLAVTPIWFGKILTNWGGVEADIRAEVKTLARCRDDAQRCPKAAWNFLAIVAQGRAQTGLARIGIINRAVNMAIEPMSDMAQWGVPDRWSAPLETLTTGRGDCEDYAIVKYAALTAAGVPAQDVKLIIVRNTAADEDHAVVAVRDDGEWIVLDNRWLTLVKDVDMPKAIPLYVLDDSGVREFVPRMMTVARRTATPASVNF